MWLAIDIGNTNIHAGVFEGDILRTSFSLSSSEPHMLHDSLAKAISTCSLKNSVSAVIISSVNPKPEEVLFECIKTRLHASPQKIGKDIPVPLSVFAEYPEKIGTDRLLNAVAAYERFHDSAIIIDAGTAITVDVINSQGAFLGGIIAPGMDISSKALHHATALLPEVSVTKKPDTILGRNTVEAIRSGIYWGAIGMVKQYIELICKELRDTPAIIATGGSAPILAREIPSISSVTQHLTLEGIKWTYKSWREKM